MTTAANIWRTYWRLILPLVLAPMLAWLFDATALDRQLVALYYDPALHGFPLRDDVVMQNVLHSGLQMVVIAIGIGLLGAWLLSFLIPQWTQHRRRLLWLFVGMGGGTLLVSLLKYNSALHCPWDLAEFGGYAPFHGLLDSLPQNVMAGRCFPGGHAAGGFALMAFYFAWRDTHARQARIALFVGLAAGMLMGWAQMMRGAHFLSHNLWAAWVVWTFLAVLYHVAPPAPSTAFNGRDADKRLVAAGAG